MTLLNNLSVARKLKHAQFSQDFQDLRSELKPAKLVDRISRSASRKVDSAADRIGEAARSRPAVFLAAGSALLTAFLYKPAKALITRFGDDSDAEEDYEEF